MASFEVSIALASIIYGFGFARLLHGVVYIFSKDRGYLTLKILWLFLFLEGITHFWGLTHNSEIENCNFIDTSVQNSNYIWIKSRKRTR